MTTKALTTTGAAMPTIDIVPDGARSNRLSHLKLFAAWQADTKREWYDPDLPEYRDHLLGRVCPNSAKAALSTIRSRYDDILLDDHTENVLTLLAELECQARGWAPEPSNVEAYVAKARRTLERGIDPKRSKVKVETVQDKTDSEYGIRLTRSQADALLASPGLVPISALRDTCILATFLCTGIRAGELRNLDVQDLRVMYKGKLALHVREGKGCKTRCVVYGGNQWALAYVDKWLARAGIVEGAVFRGFYKGGRRMRAGRLSVRAIQKIVDRYKVMIDGEKTTVHCHDLRRSYAKKWHLDGGDLVGLQQNLGHADLKTTIGYIGLLDADKRTPNAMWTPPHWGELDKLADIGAMADLVEQSEIVDAGSEGDDQVGDG